GRASIGRCRTRSAPPPTTYCCCHARKCIAEAAAGIWAMSSRTDRRPLDCAIASTASPWNSCPMLRLDPPFRLRRARQPATFARSGFRKQLERLRHQPLLDAGEMHIDDRAHGVGVREADVAEEAAAQESENPPPSCSTEKSWLHFRPPPVDFCRSRYGIGAATESARALASAR